MESPLSPGYMEATSITFTYFIYVTLHSTYHNSYFCRFTTTNETLEIAFINQQLFSTDH